MELLDEAAVARRPCGVVVVAGPDRLRYLHSLLSQDLEGAAAGTAADWLYLDAKGNPLAMGRALVRDADVLLVTQPQVAPALAEALDRFRFLLDVAVIDASSEWALASVRGPQPADVAGAPASAGTFDDDGSLLLVRDRSGGVDLVGPPALVDARVAALGLPAAGAEAFQAWRISAGEPTWGAEVAAGRRPQELGLLPTHVHLRKGCYPGQESIAKVYNLGRTRRALAVLELDGPAAVGDPLEADGRRGEITSVAAAGDRWVALGFVPLLPDGTPADLGGEVRVRRLVGQGIDQPGAPAALAARR